MNEAQSNEGYTYTRANGTVEHAPDLETAHKMCPVLGQMSLEQAGIMLKMGARGRAVAEQKEAEKAELEQTDEPAEGDMFDMPSIYDDLIGPVEAAEASESIESESVEVDTSSAEPREFKSFLETLFERNTKATEQSIEPKETRTAETKTVIEPELIEEVPPEVVEADIIHTEPELKEFPKTVEVQQAEVAPEVKITAIAEIQQEVPATTPEVTAAEVVVEKAIENIAVIPRIPEFVSEHVQPEEEVVIAELEVQPEVERILPIDEKKEVETPIDMFVIPEMIVREEPGVEMPVPKILVEQEVHSQPTAVTPEVVEVVESIPAEEPVEQQVSTIETIQEDYIEQPAVTKTSKVPVPTEQNIEIIEPVQTIAEIETIEETAPEIITETPEVLEEIILESTETSSETEQPQIQNIETEVEEKKHIPFVPITEDIEPLSTEEEDLIEQQVIVAMSTASANTTSTNKVSKLLGMFATLLHIEYTPA